MTSPGQEVTLSHLAPAATSWLHLPVLICVLGSGSRGNVTLFESEGSRLLIDTGLPLKQILERGKRALGRTIDSVDGIVLTHAHGDHTGHLRPVARHFGCPIYLSGETKESLGEQVDEFEHHLYARPGNVQIGAFSLRLIPVPHDRSNVAVVVQTKNDSAALATDLGMIPAAVAEALRSVNTLLLEFNHDRRMLQTAPYPPRIIERIAGDRGHLSNAAAAAFVETLPEVQRLVCMHLSTKANTPAKVHERARAALRTKATLFIADQDEPLLLPNTAVKPAVQLSFGL